MAKRAIAKPRGILRSPTPAGRFVHERRPPGDELSPYVEHFWFVSWQVDEPVVREVLPHPSVHVTFERGRAVVSGVPRGRFVTTLEGTGFVFGTKFRPGAFRPFVTQAVCELTGRSQPLVEVFGRAVRAYEADLRGARSMDERVAVTTTFFRARLPPVDPRVELAAAAVDRILDDSTVVSVEDLAARGATNVRALQRLFKDYVGVSPKWVIRRYRLHEALERVNAAKRVDWAALATELGWFDQAHFIRDFKALVGRTPAEYARSFERGQALVARGVGNVPLTKLGR